MDEFKDIDAELMRLKQELMSKDETLSQVKFPASGDYWRSRLDEERVIWDKKLALGSEERKALESKLKEQEEMLVRYNQSVKEIERKLETDAKMWEERLRLKEADLLIEKNRLQCETRVKEIEIERQKLLEHVTDLSNKVREIRDDQIIEVDKLKFHSKQEAEVYEEKLKIAASEARGLRDKISELDLGFKNRITELEALKEEYRVRLETVEAKLREEQQSKLAVEGEASKARGGFEQEKLTMKSAFENTVRRFGEAFHRDVGAIAGLSNVASERRLDKKTMLVMKDIAGKVRSEIGGFEKELNVKFGVNDGFKACLVMSDEDAAYWEAALSGSKIQVEKVGIKMNVKKEIAARKPRACVVTLKNMSAANKIRSKWPFVPVIVYGELTDKRAAELNKKGFLTVTAYSTADDMLLSVFEAAETSAAQPEYWDKIKVKGTWVRTAGIAAVALIIAAGVFYAKNPSFIERFGKVRSYSVPYSQPSNITFDGEYLWGCDWFGQSIYKHDTGAGLKLMRIFCFPGKHFTAIAWAKGSLWSADAWEGKIYRHNTDDNFTIVETYSAPGTSISGLAFDGKNFWSCDSSAGMIYRHAMDDNLTVEDAFESPGASPSGLFFDGKNLWSVDSKINKLFRHRMDATLSVEASFIPPLYDQKNYNLSGIAIKNNRFWVCSEKLGKVFSFPEEKMEQLK